MKYHLTPVSVGIIKNKRNDKYWRGCGEKEILVLLRKLYIVENFTEILQKKLKIKLLYNPAVLFLDI